MKPLAAVPAQIPPQGIRVIMDLAWATPDCIHLEVGEPNFPTPAHIIEAGVAAAREGWTKYTPNAGIPGLRQAIAGKMGWKNGLKVSLEQVVVHPGAVAGIASAVMALIDPGDEVLLPGLSWPNGEMFITLHGGVPVRYPLTAENQFLPAIADLEALVTPRTKALLINSPGNPTGAVFPAEVQESLVAFAKKHDLWLISDEIYEHIIFDGEHVSPARFDTDGRVITVSGFSKGYAMTGWRVGYTVSPLPVAQVITKLQEPLTSCVNAMAQRAAQAALEGPQECVEEMRAAYHRRRDLAMEVMRRHGLYRYSPSGAFYLLVDVAAAGDDTYEIARALVRDEKVAVAPGEAFGPSGKGFVRVSLANSDEALQEGLERIARFVRRHS